MGKERSLCVSTGDRHGMSRLQGKMALPSAWSLHGCGPENLGGSQGHLRGWVGWGKPSGGRQSSAKDRTSTSREKEDPGRSVWELLPITAWQLKSQGEALWEPNG